MRDDSDRVHTVRREGGGAGARRESSVDFPCRVADNSAAVNGVSAGGNPWLVAMATHKFRSSTGQLLANEHHGVDWW